jgi:hypothetical protein
MHVVWPRLASTKEVPAWNSFLSAIEVPRRSQCPYSRLASAISGPAGEDVENRFGREPRDGRAAGVLQNERDADGVEESLEPGGLGGVKLRPRRVIGDDTNHSDLAAQLVRDVHLRSD